MEIEHNLDRPPLAIVDSKNSALHLHVTTPDNFQIHVALGQFLEKVYRWSKSYFIVRIQFKQKRWISVSVLSTSYASVFKSPRNSLFCFRLKGNESTYSWTEGEACLGTYTSQVCLFCVCGCVVFHRPVCRPSGIIVWEKRLCFWPRPAAIERSQTHLRLETLSLFICRRLYSASTHTSRAAVKSRNRILSW